MTADVFTTPWRRLCEERWRRLSLEQKGTDEGDHSDAEGLGVCHRPCCEVPDTGCALTPTGQSAKKRHVEVSGKEPSRPSNVRPMKFSGFGDSIQHSQRAVELE